VSDPAGFGGGGPGSGGGAGTRLTRGRGTVCGVRRLWRAGACWGAVMIWGAEATRGAVGEVATSGAGAHRGGAEVGGGMRGAGTGEAMGGLGCLFVVLWSCCWPMTKVVKTPSMATALATTTNRYLFDCAQCKFQCKFI